jgi:hypothetical protein
MPMTTSAWRSSAALMITIGLLVIAISGWLLGPASSTSGGAGPSHPPSSFAPDASPGASGNVTDAVMTRVQISSLGADLPILRAAKTVPCGVAFVTSTTKPPASGELIYLTTAPATLHALVTTDPKTLTGTTVLLYTSDDVVWSFHVASVASHVKNRDYAKGIPAGLALVIEVPDSTKTGATKTALVALPDGQSQAASGDAHPSPSPVACH